MRKWIYALALSSLTACILPTEEEGVVKSKRDNGDMAAPKDWGPDPNAPSRSCAELNGLIARAAAACSLELLNWCDSKPEASERIPGDCPHCDHLDKLRREYAVTNKCDRPRVVE